MKPTLDIIIVNWNAGEQLRECILSINGASKSEFDLREIIVVDNASYDDSLRLLKPINLPIRIVCNRENLGFARASNQGAEGSQADYLLFLNPDSQLSESSLDQSVRFMQQDRNARIGVCGIQLLDDNGLISRTCARFPSPTLFGTKMLGLDKLFPSKCPSHFMQEWDHRQSRQVDHVVGAFYLVRRTLFERLGGFDERFFVYLEDIDFSYRAHKLGYNCYYLAEAQAYHKGGGTSEQVAGLRLFYSLRSRIQYAQKHFPWLSALLFTLGTLLIEPIIRIVLALCSPSPVDARNVLQAYAALWKTTPALIISFARKQL